MNRKEIKQMQRSILYRKLARLTRMYGQNATEMILGAVFIPVSAWVLFTGTWVIFG